MCEQFNIPVNELKGLWIVESLGYHDSICLTETARFVLTDSDGLQEESTYFKTLCLTLHPNTERPVTIEVGMNKLTQLDQLSADIEVLLKERSPFRQIPKNWGDRTDECVLNPLSENCGLETMKILTKYLRGVRFEFPISPIPFKMTT